MAEKVLMKGNEALAEAAIQCGCKHYFGYPITPQTEVAAYMSKRLPKEGGVFLQAESEIAAVNMVLGATSAGVRAMTSSSSPGISLKSEGVSYIGGSDLPALIINVQRGGPGLGGIQPSTIQEMVDFVSLAYEVGEKYRVPAMILSDGMLGQMMEPVEFPTKKDEPVADKPWATNGHQNKRKKNIINSLYIQPEELENLINERYERYAKIKENEQRAEEFMCDDAEIFVVAFGASSRVSRSAVMQARAEGIKAGLIRPITLWPFPDKTIEKNVDKAKKFLCVEMNKGQMIDDVKLVVNGRKDVEFFGRTGGVIPTPAEVLGEIRKLAGKEN